MPVRRTAPRRLDTPPPSFAEEAELLADPETPLDPDKWERWSCPRSAPRPWSYRDGALRALERGFAVQALGFDPDPEVARRAAALLADRAEEHADWYLHGATGSGTDIPTDPAELDAWRADNAGPFRYRAQFWRARLAELAAG